MQADLLSAPKPGEPAVVLTSASLSWEAGDLQRTVLHDISLQVRQRYPPHNCLHSHRASSPLHPALTQALAAYTKLQQVVAYLACQAFIMALHLHAAQGTFLAIALVIRLSGLLTQTLVIGSCVSAGVGWRAAGGGRSSRRGQVVAAVSDAGRDAAAAGVVAQLVIPPRCASSEHEAGCAACTRSDVGRRNKQLHLS